MVEHTFGSAPFAIGVEEELLLVAARSPHPLEPHASELVTAIGSPLVKTDVYEAMAECASPVCASAAEAAGELELMRERLRDAGATLAGAGLHPAAPHGEVVHVSDTRYDRIHATMRGLVERTPTCALHVHVGMPDPETAIAVFNRLRAHLPLLQALAAHSPFWHGRESGFATARDDYATSVDAWVRAGAMPDYTYLWWDIRPHPQLGTVEVRAMDAQSRLATVAGVAGLVHALAAACADGHGSVESAEALSESSFSAGRDGLAARIWWRDALRPVRDVADEALALDALDGVERILLEGNGADRMRHAHAVGGMPAVLERLVRESAETLYGYTRTTVPMRTQL